MPLPWSSSSPTPEDDFGLDTASRTWGDGDEATIDSSSRDDGRAISRYRIERELGRGAMGVVYAAWDPHLERNVALKVLVGAGHASPEGRTRFLREARAIAALDHPGVVRVYDIGAHDGLMYFAMELLTGGSLRERLKAGGAMGAVDAARLMAQVGHGLGAAHGIGLVHRDVKPANVLLDERGRARITDFGIVTRASQDARLTRVGEIIGTPAYMAPEQVLVDAGGLSPRTDVYALALIGIETLLGQHPLGRLNSAQMLQGLRDGRLVPLEEVQKRVPEELFWVLCRAISPEPQDRYADGEEMAQDLERWLRGEPVLAQAPSTWKRLRQRVRQHRRGLLVGGLGLSLLLAGATAGTAWLAAFEARGAQKLEDEAAVRLSELELRLQELEAEGAHDQVDERFATFVEDPAMRGTRALVRAWIAQAGRLDGRGDLSGAQEAFALAWGSADEPDDRVEVLLQLAQRMEANGDLDGVRGVLEALQREGLTRVDTGRLRRLRAATALADLDLAAAGQSLAELPEAEGALAPVLSALSRRRALVEVRPGSGLHLGAVEGFTGMQLWVPPGELAPQLVVQDPDTGLARALPLRGEGSPTALELPPGTLLARGLDDRVGALGQNLSLVLPDGGLGLGLPRGAGFDLVPVSGLGVEPGRFEALGQIDGDHDGAPELLFRAGRQLWQVETQGGMVAARPLLPDLRLIGSEPGGAWLSDLDGRGGEELVLGTAEWGGFDVRVYLPEGQGEGWTLAARRRLGEVVATAPLRTLEQPRVAALVQHRQALGMPRPEGEPPFRGIALLRYQDGQLSDEGRLALPERDWTSLWVGDLDGDGAEELAAVASEGTLLVGRPLSELPVRAWLPGLRVLGALQADEDPAAELLAVDDLEGMAVILGAGTPASARVSPLDAMEALPEELEDPALRARWQTAEELVHLGLRGPAADRLLEIARGEDGGLAQEPRVAMLAARRAAVLLQGGPRSGEVPAILKEASAQLPPGDGMGPELAARLRDVVDLRGEELVLRRYLEGASADAEGYQQARARSDELARRRGTEPLLVDPSQALDARVQVLEPALVRRRPELGALALQPVGGRELLRRGLHLDGGAVEVLVRLEMSRGEWGSGLALALAPRDGRAEIPLAQLGVVGGAGAVRVQVESWPGAALELAEGPAGPGPLAWSGRIGVSIDPERRRRQLSVEQGSSAEAGTHAVGRVDALPADLQLLPGDYDLVIRSATPGCSDSLYLLRELVLSGGVGDLPAGTEAPVDRAARLIAEARPEEALATLAGVGLESPAGRVAELRYLAHDQLGEELAARDALGWLLELGTTDPQLLLLAQGERVTPRLSELQGTRWLLDAAGALSCAVAQHPDTPELTTVLTRDLRALDLVDLADFPDPEERLVLASLLRARGRAWAGRAERPRARATLRHALRVLDAIDAAASEDLAVRVRVARSLVLVELATLELGDVGPEPALALIGEALRTSPTPEVLGDKLRSDERLAFLWRDPRGAGLLVQARTLGRVAAEG